MRKSNCFCLLSPFRHLNFFDIVRHDDEKELSKRYGQVLFLQISDCFHQYVWKLSSVNVLHKQLNTSEIYPNRLIILFFVFFFFFSFAALHRS